MYVSGQYRIHGCDAHGIAASVEEFVRTGVLGPGAMLPTVRALADELAVSPTTVAAAYRTLRQRGLVYGEGRRGTRVGGARSDRTRAAPPVPAGVRDLSIGAPDPALLPRYGPFLRNLHTVPRLYEKSEVLPALGAAVVSEGLLADRTGAPPFTVVSGALDGIERILAATLRPGDRVAVEDPGYANLLDLVGAAGLVCVPVAVDSHGPVPAGLGRALRAGARAVILTPRAQNPTGAAVTPARGRQLRSVLRSHSDVIVVEDDHAAAIAGCPFVSIGSGLPRWALVRSVSKTLGPDLRLAFLTGDPETVQEVRRRHRLGAGWVPMLVQELVAGLISSGAAQRKVRAAATTYAERRHALVLALAGRGVPATGETGFNVWIPVRDETAVVQTLMESGWAVAAGERFRLRSGPGIRVTTAALPVADAAGLADAIVAALRPGRYAG